MQGYAVESAENGTALDRLLTTQSPDLLLLDVNLPGEDGFAIVRRLRNAGRAHGHHHADRQCR